MSTHAEISQCKNTDTKFTVSRDYYLHKNEYFFSMAITELYKHTHTHVCVCVCVKGKQKFLEKKS